jgi:hypothetical protein
MRHLRSGVTFKAEAGLFEQFGRHREITLCRAYLAMSEVRREVRQEPLHVFAFAVPGNEANDCEGVTEIVQSGLVSGIV